MKLRDEYFETFPWLKLRSEPNTILATTPLRAHDGCGYIEETGEPMETRGIAISGRATAAFDSRGLSDPQKVEHIKTAAAALWQEIDGINVPPGNSEAGRLVALAKTELEATVMWATKAVSRT